MRKLLDKIDTQLSNLVTDDERRLSAQYSVTYALLCIVSLIMTVLNIFTHKGNLTLATGIFAALCLINVILNRKGGNYAKLAKYGLMIELLLLFGYFLVSGNPEGFSAIWIALLPACALLLYQIKEGTILSAAMLIILVFLLQTEDGNALLQYDYSSSFKMRFPILYLAAYFISLFLEAIRTKTFENYQYLMLHDPLTSALNRRGFYGKVSNQLEQGSPGPVSFMLLDLDNFKDINDTYGHEAGDEVLKQSVRRIGEITGYPVCRWGGEEFALFDNRGVFSKEFADELCSKFGDTVVLYNGNPIPVHVSIGLATVPSTSVISMVQLSKLADDCLYEAKKNGRNCAVSKVIES